jgi:hypothetical protein
MNNDDDNEIAISCSLPEWDLLWAKTEREILTALNRWKDAAQHGKTNNAGERHL